MEQETTIVQLDALVAMKIVQHCHASSKRVSGQLLGLDVDETLEVTHCFPFPSDDDASSADDQNDGVSHYQVGMMRCLREVNVDHNIVGWYQSAPLSEFMGPSFVDVQFGYQNNIRHAVVFVYGKNFKHAFYTKIYAFYIEILHFYIDPVQASHGSIGLSAYRLSDKFMQFYKDSKNIAIQQ